MSRHWRRAPLLGALFFTTLAWGLRLVTANDPVLGSGVPQQIFLFLAAVPSVVLAILVAGTAILEIGASLSDSRATGLQRVLVYVLLTFITTFAALRYLGFNLNTVLTTSAIVTAVVGFAMQATLSSVIAGLSLYADRAIHVGDSIMLDGEPVEILSLNWRSVTGRRVNGRTVVVPNGKIADAPSEILRKDRSHRAEFVFRVPLDHPPQTICDLAREAIADLPLVDRERPVAVAPVEFDPYPGDMRVRAQYWTRKFGDRSVIEGEAIRRIWYVMQRHQVNFARFTDLDVRLRGREDIVSGVTAWLARARPEGDADDLAKRLTAAAKLLFYAPDERIVLPDWTESWNLVVLRGDARRTSMFELTPEIDNTALHVQQLGPNASMAILADELSREIGPYAKYAVAAAGSVSQDYAGICRRVAEEIDDAHARERFLRKVLVPAMQTFPPGTLLKVRRNAMGVLATEPGMRAIGELVVLALPEPAELPAEAAVAPQDAAQSSSQAAPRTRATA